MVEQFPKIEKYVEQTPEEAYQEINAVLDSLYNDFGNLESLEKEWADRWCDVNMMIEVGKNEDLPDALKRLKEFNEDFRKNYKKEQYE